MKTLNSKNIRNLLATLILIFFGVSQTSAVLASHPKSNQPDTLTYVQYKGSVVDQESRAALVFATLSLEGTNISTITNSEGEFMLKIPKSTVEGKIHVSYLGYKNKFVEIRDLKPEKNRIELELLTVSLSEINVFPKDPQLLIRAAMNKRADNYNEDQNLMTAFYRETIKKKKTYVSLSEAVVEVYKQPYLSLRSDLAELYKGRKSTDYSKLDTMIFKLQGGPYTNLYLDVMKNPEMVFTEDMIGNYQFTLDNITKIGDRLIYVLGFKQYPHISEPLYYGKLYIDVESLALTSATFNLNVEDHDATSALFVKRKPAGAKVYPTEASYQIVYREKEGKWLFGYSRCQITFKVDWDKKFFNTYYESTLEMAVTDWEKITERGARPAERLKTNVVMTDQVSGFADPEFWGEYNVIEPEKPIEAAIKKIQKKLEKEN